jgi:uncharacterized integral membrane protein
MAAIRFIVKALMIAAAALAIAAAASFAVSNRTPVAVSLWPLPFEASLPLGTTLLSALAVGIVLGTALMSLSRLRLWFRARRNERKAAVLERAAARRAPEDEVRPSRPGAALPPPSVRAALGDN